MKNREMQTITTIADSNRQGLIFVKEDEIIGEYSTLAKEIMGLILPKELTHQEGKIEDGDIVVLTDFDLGNDDLLEPADLKCLNISDKSIKKGSTLLAMGVYNNKKIEPKYKVFNHYPVESRLELSEQYLGFSICASIDLEKKRMAVSVNGEEHYMDYLENVGYLVVIDGVEGNVKFFQAKGYTFRDEALGTLLRGGAFRGKNISGEKRDIYPTIGMPADDVLCGDEFLAALRSLMGREDGARAEGVFEIFRRIVYLRMVRVKKGDPAGDGVYIFVQDKDLAMETPSATSSINMEIEKREKRAMFRENPDVNDPFGRIIGNSPAMVKVKKLAQKASATRFNVILTGESGVGKSMLAREIHEAGNPGAPFVMVACNAIAPTLFEAELFGYVPGAFTGANPKGRVGYFEEASGGTVFLDEISEIPPEIQVKLLNVLQYKQIYRVGSAKPIDIDVRVITASNKDLEEEVRKGNFRQDLYYRINVFPIDIPPLRHRKRDLYVLANSILDRLCRTYGMEKKQLSEEALKTISTYEWPGNVRELENIMERAITVCDGKLIYNEHLMIPGGGRTARTLKERLDEEERQILEQVLFENGGDRKAAMEELGISRSVFYEKMKKYDLESK